MVKSAPIKFRYKCFFKVLLISQCPFPPFDSSTGANPLILHVVDLGNPYVSPYPLRFDAYKFMTWTYIYSYICQRTTMTEPRARSESLGDSTEDNPLTIRLPNPRSFLARQSQWKGRRGKPRCDHCRLNNLKVSRAP